MNTLATVRPFRFNPFDRQFRSDPYRVYDRLRDTEPVHRSMGMWVLTRYVDVLQVLRDRTFLVGLTPRQIERQAGRLGVVGHDPFLDWRVSRSCSPTTHIIRICAGSSERLSLPSVSRVSTR